MVVLVRNAVDGFSSVVRVVKSSSSSGMMLLVIIVVCCCVMVVMVALLSYPSYESLLYLVSMSALMCKVCQR